MYYIRSHINQGTVSTRCILSKFCRYVDYNHSHLLDSVGKEFESSETGKVPWSYIDVSGLHGLLQLCVKQKSITAGRSCHAVAVQWGLMTNTLTCNILINFYAKCGDVCSARSIFDRMPTRSTVSWNTMIAAHNHHGEDMEALKLFVKLHQGGTSVTEFTLSSVLCACAAKTAIIESKQLHCLALKIAMDSNVYVGTAVLDVYAKCNTIQDACWVFENMQERSSVTWSSMVAGYVQNDLHEEALVLFHKAQVMEVELTQFTLSAALSACASLAATNEGAQLHAILLRTGFGSDMYVAASLIDVYSRCGCVAEAYVVFTDIDDKSIVLWNAMIAGFSKHACIGEAMILFEKMQQIGICPNEVTYVSMLSACSHVGLVENGRTYFDLMVRDKNVRPNVLHYSCMADVLGRSGLIYEAWSLIENMPFKATASMWGSLLGSCRIHGNLNLAKVAAEHLFEIEPDNAGNHVLLSNLYAANKKWGDVAVARKLLKDSHVKKEIGKSWIAVKNKVHIFVVGDHSHPRIAEIYAKLEELESEMKKWAYKTETQCDLHDVGEDQKEELLRHHSEKLALAFGLITLPPELPIRINKNLRICSDCHSVMKFASRVTCREIIVRDTNRFHHFRGGLCTCGDFW